MHLAHTILVGDGNDTVEFSPAEPMDMLQVFQRFSCGSAKTIVTSEGKGVIRVSLVRDLDSAILNEVKSMTA